MIGSIQPWIPTHPRSNDGFHGVFSIFCVSWLKLNGKDRSFATFGDQLENENKKTTQMPTITKLLSN